jgi:hypothetical protein
VFDESFVRAARIQEYSARERLDDAARAVRNRRFWSRVGPPRQALILVALILVAFGTAVYLGIRNPYQHAPVASAQSLRITLIPLTPAKAVPAAGRVDPFAGRPAEEYRSGAQGITLPIAQRVGDFSESQVLQALTATKDYLYASSIDPDALTGGDVRKVRNLLVPGQLEQFDSSLGRPVDDGRHAATGWLVRFDPARVKLAVDDVRVSGSMRVSEAGAGVLEVATDHVLVYAVRDAARANGTPSLFTVRRELRLRFDRDDLRDHQVELVQADVEAGPLSCASAPVAYFRPLLAGQLPPAVAGVDPYDQQHEITSVCGLLAPEPSTGALSPPASPTSRTSRPQAGPGPASAPASPSGSRTSPAPTSR